MPKQQLKIDQFHGGLNTDSDPRDIADNELSALKGFSVSSLGRVCLLGSGIAVASGTNLNGNVDLSHVTNSINEGYGLFGFNSDYDDSGALVSTNYLALYDVNKGWINIYDSAGAWNAEPTGKELITANEDRDFSSSSSWQDSGTTANQFTQDSGVYNESTSSEATEGTYFTDNYLKLQATADSDGTERRFAFLDGASWESGMVVGRTYRLSYSIEITAFSAGTLSVGFGNTSHVIDTDADRTYTSTQSATTHTFDFIYAGTTDHATLVIQAAGDSVFTVYFDNFSLKPITIHTGADDSPTSTSNAIPNFYAPNGVLRFCDGLFSNVDRDNTWFGVSSKKEYASSVAGATGETASGGSVAIGGSWKRHDASIEGTTFVNSDTTKSDTASPHSNLVMHNHGADATGGGTTMENRNLIVMRGSDGGSELYSQANWGLGLDFNDNDQSDGSGTWQPDSSTYYKFYATMIYDGNQESHPKEFVMYSSQTDSDNDGLDSTGTDGLRFYESAQNDGNTNTGVATGIKVYFKPVIRLRHGGAAGDDYVFGASSLEAKTGGNERITGGRIYWSSSEDGHDTLWCIMELDFVKGVKTFGREGSSNTSYSSWVGYSGSNPGPYQNITCFSGEGNGWSDPPKIESYFSLNGYNHNSRLNAKWKTSVIANGRVYIANIKRQNLSTFDGGGTWSATQADDPEYQDRICRSPVDRFDTFPEENDIEVFGANDGDSIIKLEEFADRLFIFKKQSLQILNIANDANILEGSYPYLGLDGEHQCQSVRTDHGIAWINSTGVYFYDGNNIESLIDNKIENLWKGEYGETAFWMAHSDDIPTVGYDPSSKKLIVSRNISGAFGSSDEDALIYDFKIKAWTMDTLAFTEGYGKTNFVVYKNEMIWAEEKVTNGDDIPFKRYTINTPVAQSPIKLYTKDFDFGAPGIRKKIYKVYVSYKGDATNVTCFYGVNGDTNTFSNFYRAGAVDANGLSASTGATSSTTPFLQSGVGTDDWVLAELKPAASINNIYSFRLGFNGSSISADFEINDITIVYRMKNIK